MNPKKNSLLSVSIALALLVTTASPIGSQESPTLSPAKESLRLEDLEKMALEFNPTMAQAQDMVRSAGGRKVQAGLYPNPSRWLIDPRVSRPAWEGKKGWASFAKVMLYLRTWGPAWAATCE